MSSCQGPNVVGKIEIRGECVVIDFNDRILLRHYRVPRPETVEDYLDWVRHIRLKRLFTPRQKHRICNLIRQLWEDRPCAAKN